MRSISIIKREHRNLYAVLFTLERLVLEIEKSSKTVDFVVFHGIVFYLDSFLDRYHHPKETDYLFPAVKACCPEAGQALEQLGREHGEGERLLIKLLKSLSAYEFLGASGFPAFRDAVTEYIKFEREHASKEEKEVLPLAEAHLTSEQWQHIDTVFANNQDPMFGHKPQAEFRELFRNLSSIVPAPYGLGPELKRNPPTSRKAASDKGSTDHAKQEGRGFG